MINRKYLSYAAIAVLSLFVVTILVTFIFNPTLVEIKWPFLIMVLAAFAYYFLDGKFKVIFLAAIACFGFVFIPVNESLLIIQNGEKEIIRDTSIIMWPFGKKVSLTPQQNHVEDSLMVEGNTTANVSLYFKADRTKFDEIITNFGSYEKWQQESERLIKALLIDIIPDITQNLTQVINEYNIQEIVFQDPQNFFPQAQDYYIKFSSLTLEFEYLKSLSYAGHRSVSLFLYLIYS
jgi:hypothetical protein